MLPCPVFITMACTIYPVTYTMIQVTKAVFYAVDAKCTVPTWFVTPGEIKKQRYYRKARYWNMLSKPVNTLRLRSFLKTSENRYFFAGYAGNNRQCISTWK